MRNGAPEFRTKDWEITEGRQFKRAEETACHLVDLTGHWSGTKQVIWAEATI
jgi:hypothetical protein